MGLGSVPQIRTIPRFQHTSVLKVGNEECTILTTLLAATAKQGCTRLGFQRASIVGTLLVGSPSADT